MTYLITYDLNRPGKDYSKLFDKIKQLAGATWHCLDSTWLITSTLGAREIRDALKSVVDPSDDLLVVHVGGSWASFGLSDECNQWLSKHVAAAAAVR